MSIARRWIVAYFVLYMLPFPASAIPVVDGLLHEAAGPWRALVSWVGQALLGVDATQRFTGSGDTTYHWVEAMCVVVLATLAAAAWTASRRPVTPRVLDRARAYARVYVGGYLLVYGWSKLVPMQFPAPGPDRMIVPYGDSSPMGLLWTFMGASEPYQMLAGLAEVVAGMLLMWRRTTLLGALLAAAVLAHVVTLNFCYDVPVKLFSSHLLILTLFVLAPDLPRLAAALWSAGPVAPRSWDPFPVRRAAWRRGLTAAKVLVIASIMAGVAIGAVMDPGSDGTAPGPAVAGVYRVEGFMRGGATEREVPDALRWLRVGIHASGHGAIQHADGTAGRFGRRPGGERGELRWRRPGGEEVAVLRYVEVSDGVLTVRSDDFFGAPVSATLRRDDTPPTLTSRRFRLVQEAPFNR